MKKNILFLSNAKTATIKVSYEETSTHSAASAITSLTVIDPPATTYKIDGVSVTRESGTNPMNVGATLQLRATVSSTPAGADPGVFWSVDGGAAHVDETGKVTGITGGTVTVKATSKVDPAKSATRLVKVTDPPGGEGIIPEVINNIR